MVSTSLGLRVLLCVLSVVLTIDSGVIGVKLNDSEPQATTGSRDARFLAYGEGLTSEEFSLYPVHWTEDGKTTSDRYDDGDELVRLVEGGSDLTPDPYEVIAVKPYDSGRFGTTTTRTPPFTAPYRYTFQRTPLDITFHTTTSGKLGDTDGYYPATAALQSQEPVVMATAPTLSRVSEFVRGMLQRFGVYQYIEAYQSKGSSDGGSSSSSTSGPSTTGPSGLSSHLQRFIPHRFRPHFVSTAKGLRNIPAQLNDGQLQPAPDDVGDGLDTTQTSGSPSGQTPGNGGSTAGKTPGTSGGSSGTISSLFNTFKRKVKAIYPGTVWCGDGNQAKSENDIGFFYLTDTCCRAHDLCPITIAAGEQFNRLKNNGYFTRSHCDCDKQFFNCLKNANTLVSRQIGYTYFNLLKPQCFRYEHPKLNCTKRSKGKCLSYVVDEKQNKQWQWFDNLTF
uniref:Phospholipase A2 n=1 Tax=Anopheles culicifacies TaxID=139723 RepID=A0A182MQS7_9DIPT